MKLNIMTRSFIAAGLLTCAGNALALEAWSGQEGGDTLEVIFDSKVYTNRWYVNADNCPQNASATNYDNPWSYVRDATPSEINEYGNPTTCDAGSITPVNHDAFSAEKNYVTGDIVSYGDVNYQAKSAVPAYSFMPGAENPWQLYTPVPVWNAAQVYNKGDVAQLDGQSYEALFYTVGDNPSNPANQNPSGTNGRPWKPLGPTVEYSDAELNAAPQFSATALYEAGTLVQFQGQPYVSQAKVKSVSPVDENPWAIYTDWTGTKERVGTPKNPWPAHVYAPYVDFTLNSIPDLAKLAKEQNITHYTMAFVVAKSGEQCIPTWGTAYNLQDYAQYSKIKALREAGGDVMVSIGGANNSPLAAACKNDADLQKHYYDIVDNLNLNVLDFDIEGTWVADHESIQRRNRVVKATQDQWNKEGRKVGIWYTLPILPTGLTPDGVYVLENARDAGVELAGVNVMTMDYGNAICQSDGTEGQNIHGTCATSAIDNLFKQLKKIWPAKSDKEINAMMGTTPMIGYNDVQGEVFYQSDAKLVMEDAQKRELGMIGIWSMARDQPGVPGQVSPEHSGMTPTQAPQYAYSQIFAPFTHNDAQQNDVEFFGVKMVGGKPQIRLTISQAGAQKTTDYRLSRNNKYFGEFYHGKTYYGWQEKDAVTGSVTSQFGITVKTGDKFTLETVDATPGLSGARTLLDEFTVTPEMLK